MRPSTSSCVLSGYISSCIVTPAETLMQRRAIRSRLSIAQLQPPQYSSRSISTSIPACWCENYCPSSSSPQPCLRGNNSLLHLTQPSSWVSRRSSPTPRWLDMAVPSELLRVRLSSAARCSSPRPCMPWLEFPSVSCICPPYFILGTSSNALLQHGIRAHRLS